MEAALFVALIILSLTLIGLVIIQGRTAGLQARDSSSIYRTKRGLEKTIYQATIAIAIAFLILALLTSLPLFGSTTSAAPTGLHGLPGLF